MIDWVLWLTGLFVWVSIGGGLTVVLFALLCMTVNDWICEQ